MSDNVNRNGVDLSIFKELALDGESVSSVLLALCEGDLWFDSVNEDKVRELGYEHIEQEGGGEGGSEYCYGVFKLDGKYYRGEYSYYSYHGHDYDDIEYGLKEVFPVEKTITVYE